MDIRRRARAAELVVEIQRDGPYLGSECIEPRLAPLHDRPKRFIQGRPALGDVRFEEEVKRFSCSVLGDAFVQERQEWHQVDPSRRLSSDKQHEVTRTGPIAVYESSCYHDDMVDCLRDQLQ